MLNYPDGLYHRSVYLPDEIGLSVPQTIRHITWSGHAQGKARQVKATLPVAFPYPQVVEVEIVGGRADKVVYRHYFSRKYDIVFPLILKYRFAKTVWFCHRNDEHETLYKERYMRKENVEI